MNGVGVQGKIGALLSKLLSLEQFKELFSLSNVNGIARYLREKTVYSSYIPDNEDVHRRELEASIARRYFVELKKIKRYFSYPSKKVLEFVEMRCRVDAVKKIFRTVYLGEKLEKRFFFCDIFPEDFSYTNVNYEDVLNLFKSEPFYHILVSFSESNKDYSNLNKLENSIDFWYFSTLNRLLKLYSNKNVLVFFKKQVDLINVMWIFRARILFHYPPERVLNLILPFGYRLKKEYLNELATVSDREEFFDKLKKTPYYEIFKKKETFPEEYLMERMAERFLYRNAKKLIRTVDGFSKAIGYLHLLEYEMRDLITVIEAVRYKLSFDDAKVYLIRGDVTNA